MRARLRESKPPKSTMRWSVGSTRPTQPASRSTSRLGFRKAAQLRLDAHLGRTKVLEHVRGDAFALCRQGQQHMADANAWIAHRTTQLAGLLDDLLDSRRGNDLRRHRPLIFVQP